MFEPMFATICEPPIRTPLHIAVISGNNDLVKKLIAEDADVEALDTRGVSVFSRAMQYKNIGTMQILLDNGVDIEARDKLSNTLLHIAVQYNNTEAILCLLKNGADIEALNGRKETPLCSAASSIVKDNVIRCLVNNDANINCVDEFGSSLLSLVVMNSSNLKLISYLIESGAGISCLDNSEKDLLSYYSQNGKTEIVKYIESIESIVDEDLSPLSISFLLDNIVSKKSHLEIGDHAQSLIDFYRKNGTALNGLEDFLSGEVLGEAGSIAESYKQELDLANTAIIEAKYLEYIAINPIKIENEAVPLIEISENPDL